MKNSSSPSPTASSRSSSGANSTAAKSKILLVGRGRVAKFFESYFHRQTIQTPNLVSQLQTWNRALGAEFRDIVNEYNPTHVWLAISDDALEEFIKQNSESLKQTLNVHFSGSRGRITFGLCVAHPAHPLTTFKVTNFNDPAALTLLQNFEKVPFCLSNNSPPLQTLMPGFENESFTLDDSNRVLYHSYCSIAGNLTSLIWEEVERRWTKNLGLSREWLGPYRNQIFENLSNRQEGESVLTGPLVRGDQQTLAKQTAALMEASDPSLAKLLDVAQDLYRTRGTK